MIDNVSKLRFDDHCRFCRQPVDHEVSVGAGFSAGGLAAAHPDCFNKLSAEDYKKFLKETSTLCKKGRECPCGIFRPNCSYHNTD